MMLSRTGKSNENWNKLVIITSQPVRMITFLHNYLQPHTHVALEPGCVTPTNHFLHCNRAIYLFTLHAISKSWLWITQIIKQLIIKIAAFFVLGRKGIEYAWLKALNETYNIKKFVYIRISSQEMVNNHSLDTMTYLWVISFLRFKISIWYNVESTTLHFFLKLWKTIISRKSLWAKYIYEYF